MNDESFDPYAIASHLQPTKDDAKSSIRRIITNRFNLNETLFNVNPSLNKSTSIIATPTKLTEIIVVYALAVRTAPIRNLSRNANSKKRQRPPVNLNPKTKPLRSSSTYETKEEETRDAEYHGMQFAWRERQPNETVLKIHGVNNNISTTTDSQSATSSSSSHNILDPKHKVGLGLINSDLEITPATFLYSSLLTNNMHLSIDIEGIHQNEDDLNQLDEEQEKEKENKSFLFHGKAIINIQELFNSTTTSPSPTLPSHDLWIPIHNVTTNTSMIGAVRIIVSKLYVTSSEKNILFKENQDRKMKRNGRYANRIPPFYNYDEDDEEDYDETADVLRAGSECNEEITSKSKKSNELHRNISTAIETSICIKASTLHGEMRWKEKKEMLLKGMFYVDEVR